MRAIHTYWSLPTTQANIKTPDNRKYGGWKDKKFMLMSWAFSCLQLCKFYNNVDLVTDKAGKKILIDILKLPYQNVYVELDVLNGLNVNLWALPKIYSYSIQKGPFIHFDGDIFIWERLHFDEKVNLITQNEEINLNYNRVNWEHILPRLAYIPSYMQADSIRYSSINSYNNSVFGGSDLDFIKEYSSESLKFVYKNLKDMNKISTSEFGLMYEKYLFACYSRYLNKSVQPLFIGSEENLENITKIYSAPDKTKYIHLYGSSLKKDAQNCQSVAKFLYLEYPEYYFKICYMIKNSLI